MTSNSLGDLLLPSCIQDFESQRSLYEGLVYGFTWGCFILEGLIIKCCLSNEVKEFFKNNARGQQTAISPHHIQSTKVFLVTFIILSSMGVIGYITAITLYFPTCDLDTMYCLTKESCDVCILKINGIPIGSCYKFATGIGAFGLFIHGSMIRKSYQRMKHLGVGYEVTSTTGGGFEMT
mmetsp:Transcript_18145/g.20940  ORF Transcript_18145/g.20940 Transcript_18145/m.20940 type:complete len:179 (-) Transcript_18145:263-799(-)